jgi:flavin-dependent dehydrogenase
MTVRFIPGVAGYWWLFPRRDHVGVGICAPLAEVPTRQLLQRLEREVGESFPRLAGSGLGRYAHTIPSPGKGAASLRAVAGERWALVGDAAALADPITGEGIYFALRSAVLLADTLLATGSPVAYPEALLQDCGRELQRAAAIHDRFYAPGFAARMLRYSARSVAVRRVLADLVLGEQGYVGLKRRLLQALPGLAWDSARSLLRSPGA